MVATRMKLFLAVLVIFFLSAVPVLAKDMTKTELQEMYMDYLKSEGYTPSLDSDGDVRFKYEGGTFIIFVNEEDQEFFDMLHMGFWEIESEKEKNLALLAAKEATRKTKVAKVYLWEKNTNVSVSAEMFLQTPSDFKPHFRRLLSMMMNAKKTFIEIMKSN